METYRWFRAMMSSSDINPEFGQVTAIYKILGIWQSEETSEFRKRGWKLFYVVIYPLLPIFFFVCAFLSDNTNKSLFASQTAVGTAIIYMKLIYLLWKKEILLTFLHDAVILDSEENVAEKKKIIYFMKFVNLYLALISITLVFTVVSALPIFTDEKVLPLFMTFSLAWKYSGIIYWILYIYLVWGLFLCAVSNSITVIIWYILLKYSIQYKILGGQLKNLGARSKKTGKRDLIDVVKAHRNLRLTVEQFRSCFHNLFMIQIISSGFYICTSTFVLAFSTNENLLENATYVVAFIYGICDIFFVMYLANEIKFSSDRLSYCLFESNWMEQSQSYKRYLIILCEVLRQPQELLILQLYPMNLDTFTSIVNSAYCMFNILKSFK